MSWMKLDESFATHWKVKRLARRLGCDLIRARGFIVTFWATVLRTNPDGCLWSLDAEAIEDMAEWDGERGAFFEAMIDPAIRFLDRTENGVEVHAWMEYAGAFKEAHKKRIQREAHRKSTAKRPGTVAGQSPPERRGEEKRREGEGESAREDSEPGAQAPSRSACAPKPTKRQKGNRRALSEALSVTIKRSPDLADHHAAIGALLVDLADKLNKEVTDRSIAATIEALESFASESIEDAFSAAIARFDFVPSPAELTDMANDARARARRSQAPSIVREQNEAKRKAVTRPTHLDEEIKKLLNKASNEPSARERGSRRTIEPAGLGMIRKARAEHFKRNREQLGFRFPATEAHASNAAAVTAARAVW